MITIKIEFFGVARSRAGIGSLTLRLGQPACLGDVLERLAVRFPALAAECFEGNRLGQGYVANVDSQRFVRDPRAAVKDGTTLLIMASDCGG